MISLDDKHYYKLDLKDMSPEERWSLGPVVMIVNPKPCTGYEVDVVDIYGLVYRLLAPACSSTEGKPIFDAMLLWEDLWYPGTNINTLDNWVDEVVRVVVFQVSSSEYIAKIWVIHGSGGYLHMFILGKLTPSEIYDIVKTYQENGHILAGTPYYNKVAYVKPHGAIVPPEPVWNPNTGSWMTTPVITMKITLS